MKKGCYSLVATLSLSLLTLSIIGCGGGNPGGDNPGDTTTYAPGDAVAHQVNDTQSLVMVYVPGATYPTGYPNPDYPNSGSAYGGTASVANDYWLAQTETTYDLFMAVYNWAISVDRGDGKYTFSTLNPFGGSDDLPVTVISCASAMVWCNALTEYCNATNGQDDACVYYPDTAYATPMRSVDEYGATPYVEPCIRPDAKGFRLPTCKEFELAARYQGSDGTNAIEYPSGSGTYWTPGNHVSGDTSGWCYSSVTRALPASTVFGDFAWYGNTYAGSTDGNSGGILHPVKGKAPNALHLYDMGGNAQELSENEGFKIQHRIRGMGGCYGMGIEYSQLGAGPWSFGDLLYYISPAVGFRVAKSQ